MPLPLIFSEEDILTTCALRFDGYRYVEETGFDHLAAFDVLKQGASLPNDLLQRFCLFFMLQRHLGKWGGESLERTAPRWKLFRELFLSVAAEAVPARFEIEDKAWSERWRTHYRPRLAEVMAFVRDIHASTCYQPE